MAEKCSAKGQSDKHAKERKEQSGGPGSPSQCARPGGHERGQLGEAECAGVPEESFSSLVLSSPQSKQKPRDQVHSPGACSR